MKEEAYRIIREYFPGTKNRKIREKLRKQVLDRMNTGIPVRIGYGMLFLNGDGDQKAQRFNSDLDQCFNKKGGKNGR